MASPRSRKAAVAAPTFAYTLADVIAATQNDGFLYTLPAFHQPLLESGDVVINTMMENENGEFATRATEKHVNIASTETVADTAESTTDMTIDTSTAPTLAPKFEIESGIAIPERAARTTGLKAGRTAIYPFDALEVGQSFFVASKSDDKPAVKALASTVASANSRYTEEVEGEVRFNRKGREVAATKQLRKFKLVHAEKDGVDGARIFRVALSAE